MSRPSPHPPERRAVITGIGIVSALGLGRDAFWRGLQSLHSPVRRLDRFDTSALSAHHAAWMDEWQPARWIAPHRLKRMDRCTQYALAAAHMAVADAGLAVSADQPQPRASVSFGTALGGFGFGEQQHTVFLEKGITALPPSLGLQGFPGSTHGNLAIEFGLQGEGTTNANTCAAGNVALGDALRLIRHGYADTVIAGAGEAPLTPMIYAAFDRLNTMSTTDLPQPYRPVHRERDGFVMGEGSAMFVVESLAQATQRGAMIYGELLGYGATTEAFHMSTPAADGVALQQAIRLALADAAVNADEISYVNPHASGTQANDVNELRHLHAVLGDHALRVPISGTKPYTGHTLGAAGAMEAAVCLLAMQHSWLPPTLGLDNPDPALAGYQLIRGEGIEQRTRTLLSLSLGFGGIDTALVIGAV